MIYNCKTKYNNNIYIKYLIYVIYIAFFYLKFYNNNFNK